MFGLLGLPPLFSMLCSLTSLTVVGCLFGACGVLLASQNMTVFLRRTDWCMSDLSPHTSLHSACAGHVHLLSAATKAEHSGSGAGKHKIPGSS